MTTGQEKKIGEILVKAEHELDCWVHEKDFDIDCFSCHKSFGEQVFKAGQESKEKEFEDHECIGEDLYFECAIHNEDKDSEIEFKDIRCDKCIKNAQQEILSNPSNFGLVKIEDVEKIFKGHIICPECRGQGMVPDYDWDRSNPDDGVIVTGEHNCSECEGTGVRDKSIEEIKEELSKLKGDKK